MLRRLYCVFLTIICSMMLKLISAMSTVVGKDYEESVQKVWS